MLPNNQLSYRPFCLQNTVGKILDRINKGRIGVHLEATNSFNGRQFGFGRSKSTVDATKYITKVVEAALRGCDPRRNKFLEQGYKER